MIAVIALTLGMSAKAADERREVGGKTSNASKSKAKPKSTVAATKRKARHARIARRKAVASVARPSFGQLSGLRLTQDPLELHSSVALVMDQDTMEILVDKNAQAVLPIASLTKLMTSMVVIEAEQPLDEVLTITQADVDTEKRSGSRLAVGTGLTRGEMLHLALMSSENRAAHALGRNYPGGLAAFVEAMNARAQLLGMSGSRFVEPTGLSSLNQSSGNDLALLVNAAYQHPLIRELSVSQEHAVAVGRRTLQYRNTNRLVRNPEWDIGLQKTGYISEAGRCLVMQAELAGRKLIMVFLDSAGKYSRVGDAERVRRWIEALPAAIAPTQLADAPELPSS